MARPSAFVTAFRLLAVLRRMEAGEQVSPEDIAAEFKVTRRTAQRYLRTLRAHLGLPPLGSGRTPRRSQ